jgi:transposase-like protein
MSSPSFKEKLARLMRETGKSYQECCRILGRRGAMARARRLYEFYSERSKQEARGLR